MGDDRKRVEPYHVAVRLFPDSLATVNKIMEADGRKLEEGYIMIVPNARFLTYRYPFGLVTSVRLIGEGTKPKDAGRRNRRHRMICAGHKELFNMIRRVKVERTRLNRGQWDHEQGDNFLASAANEPLRSVVGWDDINNAEAADLCRCRADVNILKSPKLTGEVVWIPRRCWSTTDEDLSDGLLTPSWDGQGPCFRVPKYKVPPEVRKLKKYPTVTIQPAPLPLDEAQQLSDCLPHLHLHMRTSSRYTTEEHITRALHEQYDVLIDPRRLYLREDSEGWREGAHQIRLMLHPEVSAWLHVTIEHVNYDSN